MYFLCFKLYAQVSFPTWYDNSNSTSIVGGEGVVGARIIPGNGNSREVILPNRDGYIMYTVNSRNADFVSKSFGLSPKDPIYEGSGLKWGMQINASHNNVRSRIDGVQGSIIAFNLKDELKVEKKGNQILWKINEVVFRRVTINPKDTLFADINFSGLGYFEGLTINFGSEYDCYGTSTLNLNSSQMTSGTLYTKIVVSDRSALRLNRIFASDITSSLSIRIDSQLVGSKFNVILSPDTSLFLMFGENVALNVDPIRGVIQLLSGNTVLNSTSAKQQDVFSILRSNSLLQFFRNDSLYYCIHRDNTLPLSIILEPLESPFFLHDSLITSSSERTNDLVIPYCILDNISGLAKVDLIKYCGNTNMYASLGKNQLTKEEFFSKVPTKLGTLLPLDSLSFYNSVNGSRIDSIVSTNLIIRKSISVLDSLNNVNYEKSFSTNIDLEIDKLNNATWDPVRRTMKRISVPTSHIALFKNYIQPQVDSCLVSVKIDYTDRNSINSVFGFANPNSTRSLVGNHIYYGFVIKDVSLRVSHEGVVTNTVKFLRDAVLTIKFEGQTVYYLQNNKILYAGTVNTTIPMQLELFSIDLSNELKVVANTVRTEARNSNNLVSIDNLECDEEYGRVVLNSSLILGFVGAQLEKIYGGNDDIIELGPHDWRVKAGRYRLTIQSSLMGNIVKDVYVGYNVNWDIISSYVSLDGSPEQNGLNLAVPQRLESIGGGPLTDVDAYQYVSTHSHNNSLGNQEEIWVSFRILKDELNNFLTYGVLLSDQPFSKNIMAIYNKSNDAVVCMSFNGDPCFSHALVVIGNEQPSSPDDYWGDEDEDPWVDVILEVFEGNVRFKVNGAIISTLNCGANYLDFSAYFDFISHRISNIRDAVVSFGCWNFNTLPRVSRNLPHEAYRLTNSKLRLIYFEDYETDGQELNFQIFPSHYYPSSPLASLTSVASLRGENTLEIDCQDLPNGSYILELKNHKHESYYLRFIKE